MQEICFRQLGGGAAVELKEMTQACIKCGAIIPDDTRKKTCEACKKDAASAYYAYSELRFEVWQFLRNHGPARTRETIYNSMVDEEGLDWVTDALGEELIKAINEGLK